MKTAFYLPTGEELFLALKKQTRDYTPFRRKHSINEIIQNKDEQDNIKDCCSTTLKKLEHVASAFLEGFFSKKIKTKYLFITQNETVGLAEITKVDALKEEIDYAYIQGKSLYYGSARKDTLVDEKAEILREYKILLTKHYILEDNLEEIKEYKKYTSKHSRKLATALLKQRVY